MKVIVRELGDRPIVQTPAHYQAPQGAKALADIMSPETYADLCTISVDWVGDGITPVLTIYLVKFMPQYAPENLQLFWPIDMEDAFGGGNVTNDTLRGINDQLKEHFNEMVELRAAKVADGSWMRPGENVKYVN
jgi:hypothetical protein